MTGSSAIQTRASFDLVRYANCWEDADVLLDALAPGPADACLSIASAGDNSFSLLSRGPRLVVAVDISKAQVACVEIKKWCFVHFSHPVMLEFLGFTGTSSSPGMRLDRFELLAPLLSGESRAFWEKNLASLRSGLIHCGKFERYFRLFRTVILPLVHSQKTLNDLLRPKTREERVAFYERHWNNRRWNLLFNVFFSKFVMGRLGRDPEFFRYVKGSIAGLVMNRTRHAVTELSTHDNPYLRYIALGNFGNALPHYARAENFEAIRRNIDHLKILRGTAQEACAAYSDGFDAFNLSDIFEYMDSSLFESTAADLLSRARPGARLAYWNMLVSRSLAERFPGRVCADGARAQELLMRDRAFFYQRFHLDRTVNR
ncbi:MAG TPA: DUF3419 family protein [Chitinivibrionales bacterium]|nr:DUF3419 family protein [Chitinivibrionales bacterium]